MKIKKLQCAFSKYAYPFLTALLLILLGYVFFLPHVNTLFNQHEYMSFMEGWRLSDQNDKVYSFPGEVDNNIEHGFIISNTLPQHLDKQYNTLAKFCVFQNITIKIDNKIVYKTEDEYIEKRHFDINPSSYWIMVPLPEDYGGKKITMEVTSPYGDYDSSVGSIFIGSRSSIIYHILELKAAKFWISFIFMFVGFVFIFVYLIFQKRFHINKSICFIAFFIFWMGSWLFAESGLAQLFLSNAVFVNTLSFISIMLAMLSFMKYYMSLNCRHLLKLQNILLILVYAYIFIVCLLQILHIMDFYESIRVLHSLILCTLLVLSVSIFLEVFKSKNKVLNYMMYCIFILFICGIFEIYYFYYKNHFSTGNFLYLGLILCIFIISIKEIKKTVTIIELDREAEYYKKLATIDIMTGCKNRTAYEEYMKKIRKESKKGMYLSIIICDLNNLKRINDIYGHIDGDKAIVKCSEILKKEFLDISDIYRIGGDEFVILVDQPVSKEQIEYRLEQVHYDALCANHKFKFDFSIAYGYSFYRPGIDQTIEDTIKHADEYMYKNKKNYKQSKIINI